MPNPGADRPSVEETQKRWDQFAKNPTPQLRESLILQYAPLVKYVIGRMAIALPAMMDYEDVLSDGMIGLMEAAERFDPSKGVKFETYAISRIRGAIIDQLRKADRLPRSARQHMRGANQAVEALRQKLGREPQDAEVAAALDLTIDRYFAIRTNASWVTVSLNNLLDADARGEAVLAAEMLRDPKRHDVNRSLEQKEVVAALASSILELPERERLVVCLYYQDELTQSEIAKVLGISESRVSQLHARSLMWLNESMRDRGSEPAA